jgi:ATP-dependent RNA helicase SUPV3L1/SUV3
MNESLRGDLSRLQKGDAVVGFSRVNLHALKRRIETDTGRRCAIVYGGLPPEVRAQQAQLFNDPNNDYDFIVASDAIGMGLNLEVRRVVFEATNKFDGVERRMLSTSEIKQIGGRAGRYRTQRTESQADSADQDKVGLVTTMDRQDLGVVQQAFMSDAKDIPKAMLGPPAGVIEQFATFFPPDTPLSFLLLRLQETATISSMYRLHIDQAVLQISDAIQDIPLTIWDKLIFSYAPVNLRIQSLVAVLRALAKAVAYNTSGHLLDIAEMPLEVLDEEPSVSKTLDYMHQLEALHTSVSLYTWLSYRFPSVFISQEMAFHVRTLVEERLIALLEELDFTDLDMMSKRDSARKRAQSRLARVKNVIGVEGDVEETGQVLEGEQDVPALGVEEEQAHEQTARKTDVPRKTRKRKAEVA